ncbi:hypothetical protein HanRHA438_Chr10g0450331 [Helianthus annuus]|nr:hypothetical protein HanRHA438_Chr10g0450331 [Helianthus annuus]
MASFDAPLIRKVSHISKKLVIYKWGSSSTSLWKFEVVGIDIWCIDSGAKITYGGS